MIWSLHVSSTISYPLLTKMCVHRKNVTVLSGYEHSHHEFIIYARALARVCESNSRRHQIRSITYSNNIKHKHYCHQIHVRLNRDGQTSPILVSKGQHISHEPNKWFTYDRWMHRSKHLALADFQRRPSWGGLGLGWHVPKACRPRGAASHLCLIMECASAD